MLGGTGTFGFGAGVALALSREATTRFVTFSGGGVERLTATVSARVGAGLGVMKGVSVGTEDGANETGLGIDGDGWETAD